MAEQTLGSAPRSTTAIGLEHVALDLRGLARIFASTWPFMRPDLRHFLACFAGIVAMIGFGTATGFLGFEIMWDSVGQAQPLAGFQASIMLLPHDGYVNVQALPEPARYTVLIRFLILTALFVVFATTVNMLLEMYGVWILQRVNQRLRVVMVGNAERLSLRNSAGETGDAIYRVFQDSAMVTAVVENVIVVPVVELARLVTFVAVASLFSLWFAFLVVLALAVILAVLAFFTPRLRALSVLARARNSTLFARVQDTFHSMQVVKAYGYEDANAGALEQESDAALRFAFELRRQFAIVRAAAAFVLALVLFTTDFVATRLVLEQGPIFGASLLIYFGIATRTWTAAAHQARRANIDSLRVAAEELTRLWCVAQDMAMGLGRAFWLLDLKPEVVDPVHPAPMPRLIESVRFARVAFAYERGRPVLQDVDLVCPSGSVIALVGPSGAGKSTLLSLLLRIHDPDAGAICINDVDIRDLAVADLRSHVAIALQENVLFPASIRDNICYAAGRTVSDIELREAARIACAADFIEALPEGYATELGADGAKLSTGQRQRISIARAIVRDTPIVVLDEPSASLDGETERQLVANLKSWGRDRILLLVTHRMSTIRDADQIVFLEAGRILERGTHDELLSAGGAYAAFVHAGTSDE